MKKNNKIDILSCAMRGRYNSDGSTSQHLEINDEFANCITSVGKDSLILEIEDTYKIVKLGNCSNGHNEGGNVYSPKGVCNTVTAGTHGYGMGYYTVYTEE